MNSRRAATAAALAAILAAVAGGADPGPHSEWVYPRPDGRLAYKTLPAGDRITDFSAAGYRGGGVPLPDVPVVRTVAQSGGDDAPAIQAALDAAAQLTPTNGVRGAVLLRPGTFQCGTTLTIRASGVVLRGSGSGDGGTVLRLTGRPHVAIAVSGRGEPARAAGRPVAITDAYVPSGATAVTVADASGFRPGDVVRVSRPVTAKWVEFMGMDRLVRNGRPQTWLKVPGETTSERTVAAVTGPRLTFDVPLTDSFDARVLPQPASGGTVTKLADAERITGVGVEHLRIVSPPQAVGIEQPHHRALRLRGVADAWVRDVAAVDTVDSVSVGGGCRRVTVEDVAITHTVATTSSAKPADFAADGSQVLFHRCSATGDNLFYFVTGARVTGPIVLLNCTFRGGGWLQPHQRWATGLLVDGCRVVGGDIDFMNRGYYGSGHGWTIGWAVAWNCTARSFVVQRPPGAMNWAIGCVGQRATAAAPGGDGTKQPEGIYDSHGTPVLPASLYLAQLRDRLGPQAVRNIGH